MGYRHQEYPKWLYHYALEAVLVRDADHHLACFKQGYRESPDEAADYRRQMVDEAARQGATVAVPEKPAAAPAPPPKPPTDEEIEAGHRETLHATSVEDAIAIITEATDEAALLRVRQREALNPKHAGGRKGILRAIDDRIMALQAAKPAVEANALQA